MKLPVTPQSIKRCLKIILGNFLITGAYAFITVPNEIVNGGVTSFSMILGNLISIDLTYLVDFFTILLLILCYIPKKIRKSISHLLCISLIRAYCFSDFCLMESYPS